MPLSPSQSLSVPLNPSLSVPLSPSQSLSVPLNPSQSLSIPPNPLSVPLSPSQSLSIPLSPSQSLSIPLSPSQSHMSTLIRGFFVVFSIFRQVSRIFKQEIVPLLRKKKISLDRYLHIQAGDRASPVPLLRITIVLVNNSMSTIVLVNNSIFSQISCIFKQEIVPLLRIQIQ